VQLTQRIANRLVVGSVIAGFLTLMVIGLIGVNVMRRNLEFTDLVAHTYEVQDAISEYRILNERLETARRGYLLSSQPSFVAVYDQTRAQLPLTLDRIARLTLDNRAQQQRVARARALMARQLTLGQASVTHRTPSLNFEADPVVQATRELRTLTLQMAADERAKLAQRDLARLGAVEQLVGLIIAAAGLTLAIGVGSLWVIFRNINDLNAARRAVEALNEGLEDEVRSRTAELRRANEEIQRFAYIVSHDLRSPLVNVMGFTSELEAAAKPLAVLLERAEAEAPQIVTADARLAVTSDLPESLGFIRASTQKMDRLINAILRLSREGRRVLTPERIDLNALLEGIAGSLRHRADELGAVIEVAPGLPSLVTDRVAVEQILSNLVENALKYLKPGRPGRIEVRAERRADRVLVEVIDNGRGVDPKDHDRIFDLFRRSGMQDQPGEGIGLAHVRALGYRLGATVTVHSALDQGATFRVSLPAILSAEAAAA
jgi:signal transduction histidine kinase